MHAPCKHETVSARQGRAISWYEECERDRSSYCCKSSQVQQRGIRKAGRGIEEVRTTAALDAVENHRLAFWDAMLWAAAQRARVRYLVTEDLQDGFELVGVRFVNPFDAANNRLIDEILPFGVIVRPWLLPPDGFEHPAPAPSASSVQFSAPVRARMKDGLAPPH